MNKFSFLYRNYFSKIFFIVFFMASFSLYGLTEAKETEKAKPKSGEKKTVKKNNEKTPSKQVKKTTKKNDSSKNSEKTTEKNGGGKSAEKTKLKSSEKSQKKDNGTDAKLKSKQNSDTKKSSEKPLKVPDIVPPLAGSNEVTINSKSFNLNGGITLESSNKLENIKRLASEVKQSYDETQKKKPKKANRYSIKLPASYHDIDMKTASVIMDRVCLKSLGMFKTLYLPHIKTGKIKKTKDAKKTKDDIDGRTKMALFIVGSFINEVIEKYDTGNLSKGHKEFSRWIDEGSQLLAYGSLYSGKKNKNEKSGGRKSKEKNGIITYTVAKKLLRSLIERESSSVQMRSGRVNISLNMSTYPNDGSYVIGFMQESVNDFARGINLFDPEVNIKYTCKKLHKYLVRYGGNIDKMLRAYNAGEGNMDCTQAHTYSSKVMSAMNKY